LRVLTNNIDFSSWSCHSIHQECIRQATIINYRILGHYQKIYDEFGQNVFKVKGKSFNRAVFDAIMVSMAKGIVDKNFKSDLKQQYDSLLENEDFKKTIIEGTTDPRKVKLRINLAKDYFLD
jgi:hypothetical protein